MAKDRTLYQRALRYGHASNREERWQEAANAFKIAIREFPGEPEAYGGLGDALFGLRQLEKALDCYKIAARFSNGNYTYLQKVADIQERLGQLSEASRTYMAAGEILLRQRDLDTAIANWQRAVRLNPGLLGAHQRLATVFQRQDDIKAAGAHLPWWWSGCCRSRNCARPLPAHRRHRQHLRQYPCDGSAR